MCSLVMVTGPCQEYTKWLLCPLLWVLGSLLLLNQLSSSHSSFMVGHTDLGAWQRVTQSHYPPYIVMRGLLFKVWFYQMTQSTLNLLWVLNLVIVVCLLCIRLISLLAPGLCSGLLLIHTFILGSWVRYHHLPIPTWTRMWGLFLSRPSSCRLWQGLGFHPHWFHWDTWIGHILWFAWCHFFFSLCRVSPLGKCC